VIAVRVPVPNFFSHWLSRRLSLIGSYLTSCHSGTVLILNRGCKKKNSFMKAANNRYFNG
jgi:hypothetical protein